MFETPFPEISEARDKHAAAAQHPVPQQTPASAVAKVDLLALALSRFGEWRAGAAALVERYRAVAFDLSTPKGYAELTKAISEVRAPRFAAQNVAKASKSELAGVSKAIGAEEAAVTAFLDATEKRLVALRDAHDAKVAADKAEAARLEDERIAGHQAKIATIKSFLGRCQGLPAARIALGIEQLQGQAYSADDWQEFAVPAANAQCETLEAMRTLHAQTVEREADAARLKLQRADQARVAAEQADAFRQLAEQRAELARQQKVIADNVVRVTDLQGRIAEIHAAATGHERATSADLTEAITAVAALDVSEGQFQEFACLAAMARGQTLTALNLARFEAVMREDASEAERLARIPLALPTPPEPMCGECGATPEGDRGPADPNTTPFDYSAGEPQAIEAPCVGAIYSFVPGPAPVFTDGGDAFGSVAVDANLVEPTLTLGAINERIAPLSITGAGMALLGFEPAGRRKAAVLFHEADWHAMRTAMVKRLLEAA